MDDAFKYVQKEALELELEYPYKGETGTICKAIPKLGQVKLTGYQDVKENDPVALATAVAAGPVSIGIDAASPLFSLYTHGIMKRFCGHNLDHGVLLVGYGKEKDVDYWIVKNSWGASWGE